MCSHKLIFGNKVAPPRPDQTKSNLEILVPAIRVPIKKQGPERTDMLQLTYQPTVSTVHSDPLQAHQQKT